MMEKVLLVGGWEKLKSAEIYDPKTKKFYLTGNLNIGRDHHTATLLNDATILITGGTYLKKLEHYKNLSVNRPLKSAEIYHLDSGKFEKIDGMNIPRNGHTATLLNDGTVLIIGGKGETEYIREAELYNPKSKTFKIIGKTNSTYYVDPAVPLNDGRVLLIADKKTNAEIYNPETGQFKLISKPFERHSMGTFTILNDGKVLIVGGTGLGKSSNHKIAEIFDPKTETFTLTGELNIGRSLHTASLLPDARLV